MLRPSRRRRLQRRPLPRQRRPLPLRLQHPWLSDPLPLLPSPLLRQLLRPSPWPPLPLPSRYRPPLRLRRRKLPHLPRPPFRRKPRPRRLLRRGVWLCRKPAPARFIRLRSKPPRPPSRLTPACSAASRSSIAVRPVLRSVPVRRVSFPAARVPSTPRAALPLELLPAVLPLLAAARASAPAPALVAHVPVSAARVPVPAALRLRPRLAARSAPPRAAAVAGISSTPR